VDAAILRARLAGIGALGKSTGADAPVQPLPPTALAVPAWSSDGIELLDPELVPAAVLVPIILGPAPGVLLTKRTSHLKAHAGQVSFPGGRIDPADPSPEAAALREAEEEIALAPADVELMGRLPDYVTGTGYRITPVLGVVAPGVEFRPSPHEVEAVLELPVAVLLDPEAPCRRTAFFRGKWREFWVWPHPVHYIWGATAAILVHLADRLRAPEQE